MELRLSLETGFALRKGGAGPPPDPEEITDEAGDLLTDESGNTLTVG